jgi:lysophospholipase L1-like esterase
MTMRTFIRPSAWGILVLALLLPWVGGCDQGNLTPPKISSDLFRSYVAIGNSITAGFQSGGINDSTQKESYAVLLADRMGTSFNLPLLASPGCPPPLAQAFPPQSIAPNVDCALRSSPPPSTINNVAVPEAAVIDVLSNFSVSGQDTPSPDTLTSANELTSFILGGRTQLQAARDVNPTFASVWIGNNDVLGAALVGEPARATSVDSFRARFSRVVNELEDIESLRGAAFVGIADITLIPHFSSGAAYRSAKQSGVLPPNFTLDACAPSNSGSTLVPFRHGAVLLQVAQAVSEFGATITLDCSQDRTVEETIRASLSEPIADRALSQVPDAVKAISLLPEAETTVLKERVADFNDVIRNKVADEYAYLNPNPLFQNNSDRIPAFPNLSGDAPFGPLFSLDGIHPNATTHELLADAIGDEIEATYDVVLPTGSSE